MSRSSAALLEPKDVSSADRTNGPSNLLAARYRDGDPVVTAGWNDVLATIFSHRSIRAFLPDALPEHTLETIVAAAQSAASSSNLQVWSVVAVEDPARKARFAAFARGQKHVEQAPLFLVWLADLSRLDRAGAGHGRPVEALDYLESAVTAFIDTALAAQNAVVALESLGLGAVYIGAIRARIEEIAVELNLPPNVTPVFGLAIGYPDPDVKSGIKPRLRQSAILHRESYSASGESEAVAAYDESIQAFQAEQGLEQIPWSRQALNRVADAPALHDRHRLKEALTNLGFKLK
ncbi:MAG TPA: nitroreductase family protein [Skermanella sp.]|jgi:nitroreductase|nr:nitroreductase family protein [Skermanella sp.]